MIKGLGHRGARVLLTATAMLAGTTGIALATISGSTSADDGVSRIVFASTRSGNLDIYSMEAGGGLATRLTTHASSDYEPVWSPDRSKIAFASTRDGNSELYVMPAAGGTPTRLTSHSAIDSSPAWSPNGSQIAFMSTRHGNSELYVMPATGGTPTRLTSHSAIDALPAWSPNGSQIAFMSTRHGNSELYVMPATGGTPTRLTSHSAIDATPAWSPNGSQIAFTSTRTGNSDLYVMPAAGGPATNLTLNPAQDLDPDWSPGDTTPVDTTPPSAPALSFGSFASASATGNTVFFRPDAAGSFTVTSSSADAESGIKHLSFPTHGPGWTGGGTDTSEPYQGVYSFSAGAADPVEPLNVTATNNAGLSSTPSSFTVTPDGSAPATTIECNGAACSAGWYGSSPVSVSLSASDSGSGLDRIKYTTDGSDPSPSTGTVYTGAFNVAATTTVKFRGYDKVGNEESVGQQLIRFDTTAPDAPELSFSSFSNASATDQTVYFRPGAAGGFTVTGNSTDSESGVAGYSYPALGSGWSGTDGAYSFSASAADPTEPLNVTATNNAGQTSTPSSFTVTADGSAPATTIECNGAACSAGWYGSSPVSVSLSASDSGSGLDRIKYTTDGSDPSPSNGTVYAGAFNVAATTTVKFRGYDKVGNEESVGQQLVRIDTTAPTAPTLSFSSLTNSSATGQTIYFRPGAAGGFTVAASSSDAESGIAGYSYPALGSGWANTEGAYSFSASAVDPAEPLNVSTTNNAGLSSSPTSFTVTPDGTAPVSAIQCDGSACSAGWYTTSPVSVTLSASDADSGVHEIRYTTDGSDPSPINGSVYAAPFDLTATATVKFRAYDKVGNEEAVGEQLVRIDTTAPAAPALSFSSFTNASATGSTVYFRPGAAGGFTVSASSSDAESGIAGYGHPALGSGWSNTGGSYSFSAGAADPAEPNDVTATNNAGLTSAASSFTVTQDGSAPSTTIECNGAACSADWYTTSPVSVTLSAGDTGSDLDHIKYTTDGSDPRSGTVYTGPFNVAATTTVKFRAYDKVGNEESIGQQVIRIDTTAPDAPALSFGSFSNASPTGQTVYFRPGAAGSFTVTASASDSESGIAGYSYPALGSGWSNTDGVYSFTDSAVDPVEPLSVTATNNAGLTSSPSSFTVTSDGTAPETSIRCDSAECAASEYPAAVSVELSASDSGSGVDVIRYTTDGSEPTATNGTTYAEAFSVESTTTVRYRAFDKVGNAEAISEQRIDIAPVETLVAPPLDPTIPYNTYDATRFLYEGADPVQTGVAPGTIEIERASVLSGRVLTRNGEPLGGVAVSILEHPELGQTTTRPNGKYDLAVNGGGQLVLDYQKAGFIAVQRHAEVLWQDFVTVDDVVMIGYDSAVTEVQLGSGEMQVARGSVQTDADGPRQATMVFPAGTDAVMTLPDGTTQQLDQLHVRATEYTIGGNGPEAMPAELPPTSGYTYAVELSADEAVAAGATEVRFDRPIAFYVENFLDQSTGVAVPVGWYDRERGVWVPVKNGRVLKIVGETDGRADLDLFGDGEPTTAEDYTELGITDAERAELAAMYEPGQTLWRAQLEHFSPYDLNWFYQLLRTNPEEGPLPVPTETDPVAPDVPDPDENAPDVEEGCDKPGSIIGCENRTLGEELSLVGTPLKLHYESDRVPGRSDDYHLEIPVTGATVSPHLKRAVLTTNVGGAHSVSALGNGPNQRHSITVPRPRDPWGRPILWESQSSYSIDYVYKAYADELLDVFRERIEGQLQRFESRLNYFASLGPTALVRSLALELARDEIAARRRRAETTVRVLPRKEKTVSRSWVSRLNQGNRGRLGTWDARTAGFGGWTLDIHHLYDPATKTLYLGNGEKRSGTGVRQVFQTVAGTGTCGTVEDGGEALHADLCDPVGTVVAPDGSMLTSASNQVWRVDRDGKIRAVAGTGECAPFSSGRPALSATLCEVKDVELGRDGTIYVAEERQVWAVRDGVIRLVAGTGEFGNDGDEGLAVSATFQDIRGIGASPDGSLYVVDGFAGVVRRIGTDGAIARVFGTGGCSEGGDGGLAIYAGLCEPRDAAVGPDGTVYVSEAEFHQVRKLTTDGLAYMVRRNFGGGSLSVAPDGSVFGAGNSRVQRLGTDGAVTTVAGGEEEFEEGASATAAALCCLRGVGVGPDGSLYIADGGFIRKISSVLPGLTGRPISIPSGDGTEVWQFSSRGRHLRTLDGLAGAVRYEFGYDGEGRLATVTDRSGNVTTIERDGAGNATAIVAPGGRRTTLATNADGYLASVENPANETVGLEYTSDGLLTRLTRPRGNASTFTYDALGRLVRDENADGEVKTLVSDSFERGSRVTVTTGLGRSTVYEVNRGENGTIHRSVTSPTGATTSSAVETSGKRRVEYPDGSLATYVPGADPRWGMLAPYVRRLTMETPAGRTREIKETRSAELSSDDPIAGVVSLTTNTTVNGKTSTQTYDAASRTLTSRSPEGRESATAFDAKGRPVRLEPGAGRASVLLTYDAEGRPTRIAQGAQFWEYVYDARGRPISRRDALGHETAYEYDLSDRPTKVTLPSGRVHRFVYDANGNLTSAAMPSGAEHTMAYTLADRPKLYAPPGNAGYQTRYNADGERSAVEFPSGVLESFTRDAGGRLASIHDPDGNTSFSYEGTTLWANAITRAYAGGPTQELGRPRADSSQVGAVFTGPANGEFAFRYDDEFRLAGVQFDAAPELALTYDQDGLLTGSGPFSLTRGPGGEATAIADGAMTTAFAYDGLGRVTGRSQTVGGTETYRYELSLDSAGRISRKVETVAGTPHTYDYQYDADGRLLEVRRDGGLVPAELYTYDPNGNRLSNGAELAAYDAQDRLTLRGTTAYSFDADGFLTERGSDTFHYSRRGELLTATVGGDTVNYVYDGLGRRVARTDGAGTVQFLYGNPSAPYEITASRQGSVLTRYYYDEGGRLLAFDRGGARYYVGTDQVGTPHVVTDAAGTAVKTLEYSSYGELVADSDPSFELLIGFGGGVHDSLTGLVRFGARDYDPAAGRWTARDQALYRGRQANLYVYAGNNPVSLYDPYGLASVEATACALFCVGAKLAITGDGISFCGEGGFGFGAGASIDPFGDLDRTGTNMIAEASAKAGIGPLGVSGGIKATLDDCGSLKTEAKTCVGPICGKSEHDYLTGKTKGGGEVTDDITRGLKESFKSSGVGAQAKITGQVCFAFKW